MNDAQYRIHVQLTVFDICDELASKRARTHGLRISVKYQDLTSVRGTRLAILLLGD